MELNDEGPEPAAAHRTGATPQTPPTYDPRERGWQSRNLYPEDSRRKSPILALVLSLVPGLGQVYVGYYPEGFINILVVGGLIALASRGVGDFEPLCVMFLIFYWLFNIVDAGRKALLYNQALAGLGPLELPESEKLPRTHASLSAGLALIALGCLVLAHTRFGVSVEWMERWWPMALVIGGAYLAGKALLERRQTA